MKFLSWVSSIKKHPKKYHGDVIYPTIVRLTKITDIHQMSIVWETLMLSCCHVYFMCNRPHKPHTRFFLQHSDIHAISMGILGGQNSHKASPSHHKVASLVETFLLPPLVFLLKAGIISNENTQTLPWKPMFPWFVGVLTHILRAKKTIIFLWVVGVQRYLCFWWPVSRGPFSNR